MEAEKPTTAKELTPKQESYIEVENTCCLCGTELIFEHKPDEEGTGLIEQGHCPCCNVQLKEKKHPIH